MKQAFTFLLFGLLSITVQAQWSDTLNNFYDSLDMPVAQALYNQSNPLVVKSEPDGGYFVIWEDQRTNIDIYAQKYDKDGHRLWTENGVPVATGDDHQQYSTISNGVVNYCNYHNANHAASDGNGGFFIAFTTSDHNDVYVQHIKSDGSHVFADAGYPLAVHTSGLNVYYSQPQLITDDNGGFFIGYLIQNPNYSVLVYDYKDEDGTLKSYGGGLMDEYHYRIVSPTECGSRYDFSNRNGTGSDASYGAITLASFLIFPDRQGGCGMAMIKETGGSENWHPAFNWLVRVKKDCMTITKKYLEDGNTAWNTVAIEGSFCPSCILPLHLDADTIYTDAPYDVAPEYYVDEYMDSLNNRGLSYPGYLITGNFWKYDTISYKKGTVTRMYNFKSHSESVSCTVLVNDPVPPGADPIFKIVVYTNYYIDDEGVLILRPNTAAHDISKINAAVLPTDGNINAALMTWNQRNYTNSNLTDFASRGQLLAMQIYDSIPWQLVVDTVHPYPIRPADLDKLNEGISDVDTLIAPLHSDNDGYFYDYTLLGTGGKAFLVSSSNGLNNGSDPSPFYYQEAKVTRQTKDSFAVKLNTPDKRGIVFGIGSGYDHFLHLAGDGAGNATFYYIGPDGRDHVNASPVDEGGKLRWGTLGRQLNSGGVSTAYFSPSSAYLYMDADGKGVIAWSDGRETPTGYSGDNIYVRHLDSLLRPNYQPPSLKVQLLTDLSVFPNVANRSTASTPQSLVGSSNAWTTFPVEISKSGGEGGGAPSTPVAEIKDDYNLGKVTVSVYETYYNPPYNSTLIRTTPDGHPYLSRNYTITVINQPPAGASVHVRLIFTKAEFDSLKAHDASIQDPGDLAVIKQPNATGTLSSDYTPVAGEKGIKPVAWAAIENTVNGEEITTGYYIEIVINSFSNFFIGSAEDILPVSMQGFTAEAVNNTAVLAWHTASETNNSRFDIERSATGKVFTKIGSVQGHGTTSIAQDYSFTDNTPLAGNNYYRLAQVDLDGKVNYSETRMVAFGISKGALKVFPNPSKGIVHVQFPQASDGASAIELFSISGTKVLFQTVSAGDTQTDIDISFLPKGIYVLKYGNQSTKLVKE